MMEIRQPVSRCPQSSQRRYSPFARWLLPLVLAAASVSLAADPATGPIDIDPAVIKTPAVIDEWVTANKVGEMRGHAWELLAEVMRQTGQNNPWDPCRKLSVYETWESIGGVLPVFTPNELAPIEVTPLRKFTPRLVPLRQQHSQKSSTDKGNKKRLLLGGNTPASGVQPPNGPDLLSDVRYSPQLVNWIRTSGKVLSANQTGYVLKDTLANFQATNPTLDKWEMDDEKETSLPRGAVMIKPCFTVVSGKGPTVISFWNEKVKDSNRENYTSTNPSSIGEQWSNPENSPTIANEKWWQSKVIVVPPNHVPLVVYDDNGIGAKNSKGREPLKTICVNQFLSLKLDEAMAKEINEGIRKELELPGTAEAGDYAILIAMHVATHEVDDWTWQTFWWTNPAYSREELVGDGVPARLADDIANNRNHLGFLKYFRGGVGYSSLVNGDDSGGEPVICSNPYLEGPFGPEELNGVDRFIRPEDSDFMAQIGGQPKGIAAVGMRSNCVTCHRAASYPNYVIGSENHDLNYADYGKLEASDVQIFKDRLKTLYIWGVANKVTETDLP